jgi:RHS repeat-associated protein
LLTMLTQQSPAESKGYTGHKTLSDVGIIHMNGRIYDPTLGRFLQADPFIQAPKNSQSHNRYAYVMNNPMSYTDPSGYFFKSLKKFVKKWGKMIVAAVAAYYTFGMATGWVAFGELSAGMAAWGGAAAGFVSGSITTGSLKGALTGALTGAVMGGIGAAGWGGTESFFASGAAGGILSDLQGGNFGHGFWAAGLGSAAGGQYSSDATTQVLASAVVGGTISKLTGGKFANGAMSAAFAAAMRADWKKDPIPANSKVAFVGGAADDTVGAGVVRDAYNSHISKYGDDSAAYFEWTQEKELALWIDQTNGNATVIAHSYGADMAANVVANGHSVDRLVTVDPVGWLRPSMSAVSRNSNVWQNYDAGDSLKNWNNVVATMGGAWNTLPKGHATSYQRYGNLDHVQICQVFCKY